MLDPPKPCPFTILVDTAEQQPWTFQGIRGDAKDDYRPVAVKWRYSALGRHPCSLGDYSIDGYVGQVAIERKSLEDAWGTVMGWDTPHDQERGKAGRRERFKCELANLAAIPAGVVIVEASLETCLQNMPSWGNKPAEVNRKIFFRSVLSFQQDFKVNWIFAPGRRAAEVMAFRFLERFWRKQKEVERGKVRQGHRQASSSGTVARDSDVPF